MIADASAAPTTGSMAFTTAGSNWDPELTIICSVAAATDMALRATGTVPVRMALQESQQVMIRASSGIASPASPSG